MNRVCFLILHYGSTKLTYDSIASIKVLNGNENYKIVIVDNGLNLIDDFNDSSIIVLKPKSNKGFSEGNNFGFSYVKKNIDTDFLIVMNNDIVFPDRAFVEKLYENYYKTTFHLGGPDIYVPGMEYHSSPLYQDIMCEDEVNAEVNRYRKYLAYYKRRSIKRFAGYIKNELYASKIIKKQQARKSDSVGWNRQQKDVVLQGACLIFDHRFIESNDRIFEPSTFLYFEENLLTIKCRKNNWDIQYMPELTVNHLVSASTTPEHMSYDSYLKKNISKCQMQIESRTIYLQELEKYQKETCIL